MKPNYYTQLYTHLVFAVQFRKALLHKDIRTQVHKYISGIVSEMGHKSLIVNGVEDHIHIFLGLNPTQSISDAVREIKRSSSKYINEEKLCSSKFQWQGGYGAFSYSRSQIDNVYRYIENQEEHHRKKSFKAEYVACLKKFEVEYDDEYLFEFMEE